MFKASKSNIVQRQEEGSLAAAGLQCLETQCPEDSGSTFTYQTIRDAMQVVESFCERYLWVDALCIVQDNEEEKCEELSKMSAIYAGYTSQS